MTLARNIAVNLRGSGTTAAEAMRQLSIAFAGITAAQRRAQARDGRAVLAVLRANTGKAIPERQLAVLATGGNPVRLVSGLAWINEQGIAVQRELYDTPLDQYSWRLP